MTSLLLQPRSARAIHHDQVLEAFNDAKERRPDLTGPLDLAAARVVFRLEDRPWNGYSLRPQKFKDRRPAVQHGDVPTIQHDAVEYVIVYALARTWPAAQFSVDARGLVFAGLLNGYHRKSDRFYVAGLSTVLDEAAEWLNEAKSGSGGRFYVRGREIQMADGRTVLARLETVAA